MSEIMDITNSADEHHDNADNVLEPINGVDITVADLFTSFFDGIEAITFQKR